MRGWPGLDPGSIPGISTKKIIMRISRKKKPKKPLLPRYNVNLRIKAPEVRLIDIDDQNLGVFPISQALSMAREQDLDLVEINPKANPPVAKIIDFSHFKYQKEKEMRKQKVKSHVSEIKGVRLSIRISDHDMGVRIKQAEKFLSRGDKVKVEVILRGRERGKAELAYNIIEKFYNQISEKMEVKYEQDPTRQGSKITAIICKK